MLSLQRQKNNVLEHQFVLALFLGRSRTGPLLQPGPPRNFLGPWAFHSWIESTQVFYQYFAFSCHAGALVFCPFLNPFTMKLIWAIFAVAVFFCTQFSKVSESGVDYALWLALAAKSTFFTVVVGLRYALVAKQNVNFSQLWKQTTRDDSVEREHESQRAASIPKLAPYSEIWWWTTLARPQDLKSSCNDSVESGQQESPRAASAPSAPSLQPACRSDHSGEQGWRAHGI